MHTWVKAKYLRGKQNGKYKSKHNDGTRRGAARRKITNERVKAEIRASQPLVTMVLLPNGKVRFVRDESDR